MDLLGTKIEEVMLIKPRLFEDERGYFMESYNKEQFDSSVGRDVIFVQDNHSRSSRGVLRGLHYQLYPMAQGKLVRAVVGTIFDVAVDLRISSPTYGCWTAVILSAENHLQLWIPEGFAHGFLTLSETAEVLYKTTNLYSRVCERGIAWNDPTLAIEWPKSTTPTVSEKDATAPFFGEADKFVAE